MKPFYGLTLDEEQVAFVEAIMDLDKTIVFCDAPAGTGKTTMAMGAANILVQDKRNDLEGIVYIVSIIIFSSLVICAFPSWKVLPSVSS